MKKLLVGFLLGLAFVELGKSFSFLLIPNTPGKFLGGEMMLFVLKKVKGEGEMGEGRWQFLGEDA